VLDALRSPPPVEDDDQADRLPDSKPSAKITSLVDKNPRYARLVGWMRRFGPVTIFVLAVIPNPLFDVTGIIAGALRMPVWLGKIVKNIAVAYGAATGIEWLMRVFGGQIFQTEVVSGARSMPSRSIFLHKALRFCRISAQRRSE
jgi:hypothetical protein